MKNRKISKDQYLFRTGDPSAAIYLIRSGTFMITDVQGQDERHIIEIHSGDIVGEREILRRNPRTANLKAITDCEIVEIPYDFLMKQLEEIPDWIGAIMKTVISHLDRAIDFSKELYDAKYANSQNGLTKYLSILNLLSLKYKRFSPETFRNYTIQIFQEPTTKLPRLIEALDKLGYLAPKLADGSDKIEVQTQRTQELFGFVEWYNEWLHKRHENRRPLLTLADLKTLDGIMQFAEKVPPNAKGFTKLNMTKVQETSQKTLGFELTVESLNPIIAKQYLPQLTMEDAGVHVTFDRKELATLGQYCRLANVLGEAIK